MRYTTTDLRRGAEFGSTQFGGFDAASQSNCVRCWAIIQQVNRVKLTHPISLNLVCANVRVGDSAQHGLSTAGGILSFRAHCNAVDKR